MSSLTLGRSIRMTKKTSKLLFFRCTSTAETLEPVNMSYASYESASDLSQAPPLIIMHGLFGSKSNWNSLCKVYNQKSVPHRKIIAIDARNHGDSSHSQDHTYAHLAADIRTLYDQLNIQKAALMGHSMGGRAVMMFALKYPELVDKLIVADISPCSTSPNLDSMPSIFRALETVVLPAKVPMSQARAEVDVQLSKFISDKGLRSFLLTNLVEKDNGSYNWRVNIPALLANFNNVTRFPLINDLLFRGPVLFVAGGNSDYVQSKSYQHAKYIRPEEDLDLAYASYESTKTYTENDPPPTPVLILHDLMASKNNWNSLCKKYHVSTGCKVIAIDARNHGDSPHSKYHTYDNLVLDIRQFLDKMDIKKVQLLGHAMGGRTVMLFALKYPELVEKLIVIDVSPISSSETMQRIPKLLNNLKDVEFPRNVHHSEARKLVAERLEAFIRNPKVIAFLMTNLVQKSDGSYGWRFNLRALTKNIESIISFPAIHNITYEGPVLFIGGGKSDFIQKSDYPKILKLFPNAELKYIEGAGHWLHSEKPAEFLQITLEFLNKNITQ